MSFLTPVAFGLAALLPVVVALYFLKLRREEQRVSSTYLWRTLVRDTAANAPWQRLKPNLLLLLQLLFLAGLIVALARPFTWSTAAAGSHLILVVDTSASMGASDVRPQRLAEAAAQARRLIDALPGSARVTVIEAGAQVRVPVSGATDRAAAWAALAALRPGAGDADMASALTLAAALVAREPEGEVAILSDGNVAVPAGLTLPCRVRYIPIGSGDDNQAIGAFSVHAEAGGRDLSAFVQVANYGPRQAERRLVLRDDAGRLIAARDLALAPESVQAITIPGLPTTAPEVQGFEASLEGQDMLAADDRARSSGPATGKVDVRLVSTGNRFLETALRLLPNLEVTLVEPDKLPEGPAGALTILDATLPGETLPAGDLLVIAPPRSTDAFSVTGRLDAPVPVALAADDPILRYVDLRDVAIQEAARLALPAWGRAALVDSRTNAPLLVVGEQAGRQLAVLAFDLRRSDLALRVAFPLLLANVVDALAPGRSVSAPAAGEAGSPPAIPAGESDIAPRATLPVAGAEPAGAAELQRARDEWWRPAAWAALALLVAEWLLAQRGRVAWLLKAARR